ncbi:DinB family protein [Mucilaginibacter sp.]|jgi:hypothetical protein|uniref:DinB family protein n=1 Tax=Mucilaginibacter sp. TaxID=1882438 RepID=UPI003569DBED
MIDIALKINDEVNSFLNNTSPNINWGNLPENGKWSNKEIIGHLIDSAHINLQRFIRCTYEDGFKLIYHQDEWVKAQHYKDADVAELLLLWKLVNRQIARVLTNYPDDRMSATCNNSREGVTLYAVEFLANDYLAHMQHHLNQLKS